jgi:hypothetical protein
VGRGLAVKHQREITLRDLLQDIQHNQAETSHHMRLVVGIITPIFLIISYLASRYRLKPFSNCSSRGQRPQRQSLPPRPLRRKQIDHTLSVIKEEGTSGQTDQVSIHSRLDSRWPRTLGNNLTGAS